MAPTVAVDTCDRAATSSVSTKVESSNDDEENAAAASVTMPSLAATEPTRNKKVPSGEIRLAELSMGPKVLKPPLLIPSSHSIMVQRNQDNLAP
ncbi:unnamed protein product [Linum trigynum]|uniref:Uncharacterized protein n=1 Tax=Linum trigynum TaxID=586398 RepID=A0AAV2DUC5_9ROSI